ncbi:hypothetical protein TRVL_07328 [Trypanosoma vivax]|nr:hypothetical protein TRVL_07328 [Trypanosoma vivax]
METFRERTLANRYQPRQHLPPEFPKVLKEYAREVLREQPEDVLQWSANYFKRLALEMDAQGQQKYQSGEPPSLPDQVDTDDEQAIETEEHHTVEEVDIVEKQIHDYANMLADFDDDLSGTLPASVIKRALVRSCKITPSQALYILTASRLVEGSTMIDYNAFARESFPILQLLQKEGRDFVVDQTETATVHGLSRTEVAQEFLRIFRYADGSDTGLLPISKYMDVLQSLPYHLTRRDLRVLRVEAVLHGQDDVEYERELEFMFDRLLLARQFSLADGGE